MKHTLSLESVQEHVIRAKEQARAQGIANENIDSVAAIQVLMELMGENSVPSKLGNEPTELPETFAEWSTRFGLESHFDRFLAVAVYLREQQRKMVVSSADVMLMYEKARWQKPKNPADVFGKAANRMLFTESEANPDSASKVWQITRTGHQHLYSLERVED